MLQKDRFVFDTIAVREPAFTRKPSQMAEAIAAIAEYRRILVRKAFLKKGCLAPVSFSTFVLR